MRIQKIGLILFVTLSTSSCKPSTNSVDFFHVSKYVLPFVIALVVFHLSEMYNRHKKARVKSSFFTFKRFRTIITVFLMTVAASVVVILLPDKKPSTPLELIDYAKKIKEPQLELEGLRLNHFENPTDPISTFDYFKKLTELDDDTYTHTNRLITEYKALEGHYFELACLNALKLDFDKAAFYSITLNEHQPVVCFIKSQIALYNSDSIAFINYLIQEIEFDGLKKEAYPLLADYFQQTHNDELLYSLVKSDPTLLYLSNQLAGRVYFQHGDIIRYASTVILYIYRKLNVYSFFGALIILIAYTIFLRELDLFNKEKWTWVIIMVTYGMISPFFVFPFSEFLNHSLHWQVKGNLLSEFIFYTFNVGLVEEYVKLFPFIIFLMFTKKLKEPYDYMLYTALVALGFAFTENLIYFTDQGVGIMQIRGMLSVIGHAMFTSSVGYLLAFSRFKKRLAPTWILLVIGLALAALLHGIFNFLIGSHSGILILKVIFFFYFLALVHMWSIMLNNCMNNSSFFSFKALPQLKNFHFKATVVLVSIILTEFILTTISVGKEYAVNGLLQFVYPGLYLTLFLSNTLGRFDFFKNYWENISPPFRELIFPRTANTNEYVGKKISITPTETNKMKDLGIHHGVITDRKIYNNSTHWFIVKLTEALPVEDVNQQLVLIEFGASGASLEEELNSECDIYLIPKGTDYLKIKIKGLLLYVGEAQLNIL